MRSTDYINDKAFACLKRVIVTRAVYLSWIEFYQFDIQNSEHWDALGRNHITSTQQKEDQAKKKKPTKKQAECRFASRPGNFQAIMFVSAFRVPSRPCCVYRTYYCFVDLSWNVPLSPANLIPCRVTCGHQEMTVLRNFGILLRYRSIPMSEQKSRKKKKQKITINIKIQKEIYGRKKNKEKENRRSGKKMKKEVQLPPSTSEEGLGGAAQSAFCVRATSPCKRVKDSYTACTWRGLSLSLNKLQDHANLKSLKHTVVILTRTLLGGGHRKQVGGHRY